MRVPDTAIEAEINRRILTHYNGKRDELLEHLRRNGMTYSEFRDAVRKESTVGMLRNSRFDRDIPPTPDEIRAEYAATKYDYRDITKDSVRYEKMLLPFETFGDPNETYEEKMERAVQLVESIQRGEISFADAAILHSRDEFAAEGGQWPFRRRCDLSVDFANIVFAAPKGKLVGPIPSASGFTIVRVQEVKRATPPSLKSAGVKARVEDSVRRKKTEERYREWIKRLRDKAVIRTYI